MNRDTTIIQVAVLMIALAILGIAIRRQQAPSSVSTTPVQIKEQQTNPTLTGENAWWTLLVSWTIQWTGTIVTSPTPNSRPVELQDSPRANLVKQYFAHVQAKEFKEACGLLSSGKCSAIRQAAVDAFSQEFLKLTNGYEYISVKDFWYQSPSGKDVVCVKYSYRYKDDSNPGLISEIMSYYIEEDVGKFVISDRVCEKKYKDWSGERPCPVQATQDFCVGKIR
jgi:hypothetical protein